MIIAIRTDAGVNMGIGHLMRCLTLAEVLRNNNIDITFISREHEGNLFKVIEDKGFKLKKLKKNKKKFTGNNIYDEWLGLPWERDAEETKKFLCDGDSWDWLIVDHYALDYRWQNKLKENYKKLMVIDDLANRKHDCDLLLDQTFGRKNEDYTGLVPGDCKLLIGSRYALLRPEFPQWRGYSLQRRAKPELKNIIISMGGTDQNNLTGQVLEALKTCTLPKVLTITVILGATAPNVDMVKQLAVTMPNVTDVKVNVENMAELMANADLAIGAAGATTWERCCLGVPSVLVVLADNQKIIAQHVAEYNVGITLEVNQLNKLCKKLSFVESHLKTLAFNSAEVTNGQGVMYTVNFIT